LKGLELTTTDIHPHKTNPRRISQILSPSLDPVATVYHCAGPCDKLRQTSTLAMQTTCRLAI